MAKSVKMTVKGGGAVDPESKLDKKAHVLKSKDTLYAVVLGAVDIQSDKNSYYKLQVCHFYSIQKIEKTTAHITAATTTANKHATHIKASR